MANVLVEIPDALLVRIEEALLKLNGPPTGQPGKYSLSKAEREEASTLGMALGQKAAKAWIDTILRKADVRMSRRAFIVKLLDVGLEHAEITPHSKEPGTEELLRLVKANQKKRGSPFA